MFSAELKELDSTLNYLAGQSVKRLRNQFGVGSQTAVEHIAVAGDNSKRLRKVAVFAVLCGANLLQVASEKTVRYRIN